MNAHAKNAAYCAAALAAVAIPVHLVHDYAYVYLPLSGAVIDESVRCDAECARQAEAPSDYRSARCLELEDDRFVCRSERGFGRPIGDECGNHPLCPGLEASRVSSDPPVTYGEILTLLDGSDAEVGFFRHSIRGRA